MPTYWAVYLTAARATLGVVVLPVTSKPRGGGSTVYTHHTPMNEPSEANINHRDYLFKLQKWEMHNDLQTMVVSGQNDKYAISLSLTIYTSMFLWGPGQGVGPGSKCGSWCHTRHTAVVSPRHGVSHSPHRRYSPDSASPLTESPWSPEHRETIYIQHQNLQIIKHLFRTKTHFKYRSSIIQNEIV